MAHIRQSRQDSGLCLTAKNKSIVVRWFLFARNRCQKTRESAVSGSGFRVQYFRKTILGAGFREKVFMCKVSDMSVRVQVSGIGIRVQGFGYRV